MNSVNLAIIFDSFGPYHVARLNSAGKDGNILGIELFGNTGKYVFGNSYENSSFQRITLFANKNRKEIPRKKVINKLFQCLNQYQPDVVAIPGWADPFALAALEWALINSKPVIMMSDSNKEDAKRNFLQEYVKQKIVHCCSSGFVGGTPQSKYLQELGLDQKKIFFGFDVVDNDYFNISSQKIRELNQNIQEQYFLCCARLIPEKNIPILISAYAQYLKSLDNSKVPLNLILVGDGPLNQSIKNIIKSLKLEKHVFLAGNQSYQSLPEFYAFARALILPSIKDTWGLVINEAMASGLPVLVSTKCGCAYDLVSNGINGFTFNPSDVVQIAELMLRVSLARDEDLSKMGNASYHKINEWGLSLFSKGIWLSANVAKSCPPKHNFFNLIFIKFLRFLLSLSSKL